MLLWTRRDLLVFFVVSVVPVALYEVLGLKWLHLPWLPIALIGTAVAFIVSFQNNASYDRLWEARKIWGGIVNSSRAWGVMVRDFITNESSDEPVSEAELGELRKTLIFRHVAWLTALRHALRQPRPWETHLRHQTNREWADRIGVREKRFTVEEELDGYLSDAELAHIDAVANKPAQILALQSKSLKELRSRDLIDAFTHMQLEGVLADLYAFQGKSERIKNFPYPRQYATLNGSFLWIFIVLLPLGVMFEFDKLGQELSASYPWIGDHFVWLSVPFSMMVMWVFHTMERIGRSSENPFEGKSIDIPITTMSRSIEIDLRQMLGEDQATIPAPIEPQYDTQT